MNNEKLLSTLKIGYIITVIIATLLLLLVRGVCLRSVSNVEERNRALTERLRQSESDLKQYAIDVERLTSELNEAGKTIDNLTSSLNESQATVVYLRSSITEVSAGLETGINGLTSITDRARRIDQIASLLVKASQSLQNINTN
jgi:predicted RNase H-like nuclease (RuvC/YqgF family)